MNEECLICTPNVSMLACGQGKILSFDTINFRIAKVLK